MKYKCVSGLILCLGVFCGCRQSKITDDPEKLKNVLLAYFDGIATKDHNKMIEATTSDFTVFEDGKVWTNDSVFKEMSRVPFTVAYKQDNFKINVDQVSGDMTYYSHGDFIFNDTAKLSLNWVESATFRKDKQGWKMNFLHVTKRK